MADIIQEQITFTLRLKIDFVGIMIMLNFHIMLLMTLVMIYEKGVVWNKGS